MKTYKQLSRKNYTNFTNIMAFDYFMQTRGNLAHNFYLHFNFHLLLDTPCVLLTQGTPQISLAHLLSNLNTR